MAHQVTFEVPKRTVPNFFDASWAGFEWTDWLPLESNVGVFGESVPAEPGLYRVKVRDKEVLSYVGQTGRNLRERVRALGIHTYGNDLPWNDPHTAAPGHRALQIEEAFEFDFSTTSVECLTEVRQCIEDWLLYEYRLEAGFSTLCNHGRFHPGWTRPSNRKARRCMARIGDHQPSELFRSLPPASYSDDPASDDWLGLAWSDLIVLETVSSETVPRSGVYRLFDVEGVIYLGESSALLGRLKSHSANISKELLASWVEMPNATKVELLERETDLVGAYYKALHVPPSLQYRKEARRPRKS